VAPEPASDARQTGRWVERSLHTLVGQRRESGSRPSGRTPLKDLFTDLFTYLLFFRDTCAERNPPYQDVRAEVMRLVARQEQQSQEAGIPHESFQEARFAVLSWADEVIFTSAWPQRSQWQHLMLHYHGTLNAGEEFFQRLERLPSTATEIRELYYLCLDLGFAGQYAVDAQPQQRRELQRKVFKQLTHGQEDPLRSGARLFPEAYLRVAAAARAMGPSLRAWWIGGSVLVVLALFATYYWLLGREVDRVLALLQAPVTAVAPAPKPWSQTLVGDLRRKNIDAKETPRGVVITLPDLLFEVNSSDLSRSGQLSVGEVAASVQLYARRQMVRVEGHASREPGTPEDRNQTLSEERARKTGDLLVGAGVQRERLTTRGFGSTREVAPNDSEPNRRRNRRVEIVVEY
jgi:type VI secretion system protein ImpK